MLEIVRVPITKLSINQWSYLNAKYSKSTLTCLLHRNQKRIIIKSHQHLAINSWQEFLGRTRNSSTSQSVPWQSRFSCVKGSDKRPITRMRSWMFSVLKTNSNKQSSISWFYLLSTWMSYVFLLKLSQNNAERIKLPLHA